MMIGHGTLTVLGEESTMMIAVAGHMHVTVAMTVFFITLRRAVIRAAPASRILSAKTDGRRTIAGVRRF
jgi:hypothetical protein